MTLDDTIERIRSAGTDNFVKLVALSGLDPARDFRFANFEGMDFSDCHLNGFDFTGADFSRAFIGNADFTGAITKGAMFPKAPNSAINSKRAKIVEAMSGALEERFVSISDTLYEGTRRQTRLVCTISKRYDNNRSYWYAYHPKWDKFLSEASDAYFVLGCTDQDLAFSIPRSVVVDYLPRLHVSKYRGGQYWHFRIQMSRSGKDFELLVPRGESVKLEVYQVILQGKALVYSRE